MVDDHILPVDTQAILLLCGHFSGNGSPSVRPLSLAEYNLLASRLRKEGLRPGDIMGGEAQEKVEQICSSKIAPERLRALLGRGVEMGFAVEEWSRQGIWVISRGDASYPRALKGRLRESAPALFFGVGDIGLLNGGGLGIVGSRDADEPALNFTRAVACRCAEEHITVVSGGAKGVDNEAIQAALNAGGRVVAVLPEGISRVAVSRANREPVADGRLTLVSPYHPNARWTRGNAMGRNKHIYALSNWTLVVSSETDGGTWSGAVENLKKRWGRLLVRAAEGAPEGNARLIQLGGTPLTPVAVEQAESLQNLLKNLHEPREGAGNAAPTLFSALEAAIVPGAIAKSPALPPPDAEVKQEAGGEGADIRDTDASQNTAPDAMPETGDLFHLVWPHLSCAFDQERSEKEIAEVAASFNLQAGQMKAWIKQAIEQGYIEKRSRPVRYIKR